MVSLMSKLTSIDERGFGPVRWKVEILSFSVRVFLNLLAARTNLQVYLESLAATAQHHPEDSLWK